ncbi:MAG: SAM-dependent chlorinase/fluorinase [Candidatus Bathyarchaeia archaeon]|jgi:hypothetical protein
MGAYVLASAAQYFPKDTVHVAVVDPSVGTKRRSIIVKTKHAIYVGPDNGLLILAANKQEIQNVYQITDPKYLLPKVSNTFHGRDIFAPVAAHLAAGVDPSLFGPQITDYVFPTYVEPQTKHGELFGEVLYIDDFGNIISNISVDLLKKTGFCEGNSLLIKVGEKRLSLPYYSTYGAVPVGASLALVGSGDLLEVAVNQGNAAKLFGANVGDVFCVSETG